ncbi:Fe-S cluster assembly protein SufB [Desulfurococcus mucosus]|uniref:Iron-regulated ABC transporter membrane component SufB n=1 Tax=Desulfurococcus mucosus (strain ATCC 35584 / DSM 2162 / JCM 9187 / O7/1) TaxID=765177 RepID=E8R7I5_DESM0|nr:Fe-S cluster assembly protein SufB [Desulfurococcus mucosus]ADV64480.1 Iron-regulated ABC transporter membrane component SufB [Desulfurococcus mucosus DSM 2162]
MAVELSKSLEHGEMEPAEYRKEIELKGRISRDIVEEISRLKKEPEWMRLHRLRALEEFYRLPSPNWLPWIRSIDLDEVASYYVKPETTGASSFEELPDEIRRIYDALGLPEAYAKYLAGLSTVLDSENVYTVMKDLLKELGVVMVPMDEAVQKYPDMVKKYFGRVFPYTDHKFAALHHALWSGGVFVYVPKGVRVPYPVEAFFFIGSELEGQFEHTVVVADEGSEITFIEGCSAPRLKKFSFHDGMVELYAHKEARVNFVTVQNWSRNIVNFNNKRGIAEENAVIEWIEGSIGSKVTVTYPTTILKGRGARTASTVIGISNGDTVKDTGSKVIHAAPSTSSRIVSKSISGRGGVNVYRGLIQVNKGASNSKSYTQCDSLILDEKSSSSTYPIIHVMEEDADIGHEATTIRVTDDQLFYLASRGLSEKEALSLIVLGFVKDIFPRLPFEYVAMLSKVIQLEFRELGGVG